MDEQTAEKKPYLRWRGDVERHKECGKLGAAITNAKPKELRFEWNSKGGKANTTEHLREAGRKGAAVRWANYRAKKTPESLILSNRSKKSVLK